MLKMKMYDYIRYAYYELGHSISKISTDCGKNWRTVKKAVEGTGPRYALEKPRNKPVMGPYVDVVRGWLQKDKEEKHKKQHHTAIRVYHRLVKEHGFQGGESTVRDFVRQLKQEIGLERKEITLLQLVIMQMQIVQILMHLVIMLWHRIVDRMQWGQVQLQQDYVVLQ